MQRTITLKNVLAHPYFSVGCVLAIFFVLPRFGGVAVTVGCAAMLSAFVWAQPDRFRSRNHSLRMAICLVIVMWIAAVVVTAFTLAGELGP